MQYDKVHTFLLHKLQNELPTFLTYHNAVHTQSVIDSVEQLAIAEKIQGDDLILLKTAALFHDAGFLHVHHAHSHEERSCRFAEKLLPNYGYSHEQIDEICQLIMATRMPQNPSDHLGQILCDADLYYLGTEQYASTADKLYKEFKKDGQVKTPSEWLLKQVEFLDSHHYFTQTAINEREPQKQKNLAVLRANFEQSIESHRKINVLEIIQDFILMLFGVLFTGFALKGFLVPNRFFDGGISGISLLFHEIYHFNLAATILILNLPLIIVSYFTVGHRFAYRTLLAIIMLGVCLLYLPEYALTEDKLLISIFGGVFMGIGMGLIMRAGAALDGIEVLALYTLKRTSFTITEIILGINILIFTIAAFKFGIETALYSILTYFAASQSADYVVEGLQAYTGVTIISAESEVIKYQLVNKLGRGITVYKGQRGFLPGKFEVSSNCDIIFTVITRLEMRKLKNLVFEADPKAFVFASTIKEASGGIIKRRQH